MSDHVETPPEEAVEDVQRKQKNQTTDSNN